MEIISRKNLNKLLEMGFEITFESDSFVTLYHGQYDLGIDLYLPDKKDDYNGVYMSITRDRIALKECKGRNVISNITKYINNIILK